MAVKHLQGAILLLSATRGRCSYLGFAFEKIKICPLSIICGNSMCYGENNEPECIHPSLGQHPNDDQTHNTHAQTTVENAHKYCVKKQQLHKPKTAQHLQEHRATQNIELVTLSFWIQQFQNAFECDSCGQTDKGRGGRERGEGRFEINHLSHPIIISAWLLSSPVGPVCAEWTPKAISASADTAAWGGRGVFMLFNTYSLHFTSPQILIALLSDGHF